MRSRCRDTRQPGLRLHRRRLYALVYRACGASGQNTGRCSSQNDTQRVHWSCLRATGRCRHPRLAVAYEAKKSLPIANGSPRCAGERPVCRRPQHLMSPDFKISGSLLKPCTKCFTEPGRCIAFDTEHELKLSPSLKQCGLQSVIVLLYLAC